MELTLEITKASLRTFAPRSNFHKPFFENGCLIRKAYQRRKCISSFLDIGIQNLDSLESCILKNALHKLIRYGSHPYSNQKSLYKLLYPFFARFKVVFFSKKVCGWLLSPLQNYGDSIKEDSTTNLPLDQTDKLF